MKTRDELGLLDWEKGIRNELNPVFDNCPGQNKNKHVLHLVPYLVELSYFKWVNFMFLVIGHTKNICNQMFNRLKCRYHQENVYSYHGDLLQLLRLDHITVLPAVEDGNFKDYRKFLSKFYCDYETISNISFHAPNLMTFLCMTRLKWLLGNRQVKI
jgi:hypothetical protein